MNLKVEGMRTAGMIGAATAVLSLLCLLALLAPGNAVTAPGDTANLRVTKSDSPDPVTEGGLLTYTIEVRNLGPDGATGVTLDDDLPAGVEFVSASTSSGTCERRGRNVDCALGNLADNATAEVTIRVRPQKSGSISNTASADSVENDPQAANNTDTETTTVNAPPPPPPTGPTCRGVPATRVGTGGNDTLTGTAGRDVIAAFAGNDIIFGFGGKDLICAGRDNDLVRGGAFGDRVIGAGGADRLLGQGGADVLRGNRGNDTLRGGAGGDLLVGGRNSDLCRGGLGVDVLRSCER